MINSIEARLKELDTEKSELEMWQGLDTDRRCLEYTLFDLELKEATEKLAALDKAKTMGST